jgi:purine-binding chemotaxis protein CheW
MSEKKEFANKFQPSSPFREQSDNNLDIEFEAPANLPVWDLEQDNIIEFDPDSDANAAQLELSFKASPNEIKGFEICAGPAAAHRPQEPIVPMPNPPLEKRSINSGQFEMPVELATDAEGSGQDSLADIISLIDFEMENGGNLLQPISRQIESKLSHQRYIIFQLENTQYAVPLSNVIEMGRVPKITFVPRLPDWVRGVTNLRGDILAVIDLRALLGIASANEIEFSRMLVVRSGQSELMTGLVVDQVKGIQELANDEIRPPVTFIEDKICDFLLGVHGSGEQLLAVIDMERFLMLPELRQFAAI